MTVTEKSSRKVIVGAGWANPLTHDYKVENTSYVHVFADDYELVGGVDYSVTGVGAAGGYTVTITTPGSWAPDVWVLDARPPVDQGKDLTSGGTFGIKYMDGLDKLALRVQRVYDLAKRAVKVPISTTVGVSYDMPELDNGKVLGWGAAGLENKTLLTLGAALVDDDVTMAGDSSVNVPSQHAAKSYIDAAPATPTLQAALRDRLDVAPYIPTRAALKTLDTAKDTTAILTEQGREGVFQWRAGNFATVIGLDVAEGLYIKADAVAASAGAWVRQRSDLDVMIDWFGARTGAAAGANAAANDAAFASARALANVFTVKYSGFIYEHATTLTLNRSGLNIKGYAGFPVFGNGGATTTIIKWTGADNGLILQIREANGNDCSNNTIEGIEFDGNFLAGLGVDVINTQFATVRKCSIHNMRSAGTPIGLRTGTTAVAGTGINCAYRGRFEDITIGVTNNGVGVYLGGTAGVGNTTFCVYENIHVVHKDNAGFYLSSCDDVTFINCATSRIAAGTGNAITFDGTGAQWVVGNQFYGFHAGVTDGVATIVATGAKARQNKIYGSSGVDNNPTITMIGGAHLQYDFLGTGYSSDLATEAAMHLMAAAHVTKLRLGYDYAVNYATWDRDATANGKAISNNPGTGGHEWQVGGVPAVNVTLGNLTVTSSDAGSGVGPLLELFRDSASPAASDNMGYLYFTGRSSTGVKRTYVDMFVQINDATNGSEDATLITRVMLNGTLLQFAQSNTQYSYPSGYKLDFGAGNYTITHSAGKMTMNGEWIANGTPTNDNAAAGKVGEYLETVVASGAAVALASGTDKDMAALVFATGGDYDVDVVFQFVGAATTTLASLLGSLSATLNTRDATAGRMAVQAYTGIAAFNTVAAFGNVITVVLPPLRVSVAAGATWHAVANAVFGVSTCSVFGIIRARRVR